MYGGNKAPTNSSMADIDVLIFDIQDIGVRYYTYISTLTLAMEKAAEHNVDFIVLDRPNPINGIDISGPMLKNINVFGLLLKLNFEIVNLLTQWP